MNTCKACWLVSWGEFFLFFMVEEVPALAWFLGGMMIRILGGGGIVLCCFLGGTMILILLIQEECLEEDCPA